MTTHFISQTEITLDKYLYWANHPIGKNARKKLRTHNIICVFGIIFSLIGGIFCLKNGAFDFGIIYLAFFAAFVWKALFQRTRANKKLYVDTIKAQGGAGWIRSITFAGNIQVEDNNSVTTFKYSDFKKVTESDRYYLLYRDENLVLRVEKGSFITGDEAAFMSFITKRIKNK